MLTYFAPKLSHIGNNLLNKLKYILQTKSKSSNRLFSMNFATLRILMKVGNLNTHGSKCTLLSAHESKFIAVVRGG